MSDASFPQPTVPVTDYSRVWWAIDPRDRYVCCPDCQRLAAASPYTAPGAGGNELRQTPGDGGTSCGGACTCAQAYVPPNLLRWQPLSALTPDERKMRLYPKEEIARLIDEEGGLESLPDPPQEPAPVTAPPSYTAAPSIPLAPPMLSQPTMPPPPPTSYPPQGLQYQQQSPQFPSPQYQPTYQPQYSQPLYPQQATQAHYYPPQPIPYPPPAAPQPQVVYYQNQSFTGKAVVAFLLYWLGYIPGLIFNIMFINEAGRIKDETGRTPAGYGCLWATLIGSLLPALLFFGICMLTLLGMAAGGATTH